MTTSTTAPLRRALAVWLAERDGYVVLNEIQISLYSDRVDEILRIVAEHSDRALQRVLAIDPEDHATTSRDYGRGFAAAIRLVREAISGSTATVR